MVVKWRGRNNLLSIRTKGRQLISSYLCLQYLPRPSKYEQYGFPEEEKYLSVLARYTLLKDENLLWFEGARLLRPNEVVL